MAAKEEASDAAAAAAKVATPRATDATLDHAEEAFQDSKRRAAEAFGRDAAAAEEEAEFMAELERVTADESAVPASERAEQERAAAAVATAQAEADAAREASKGRAAAAIAAARARLSRAPAVDPALSTTVTDRDPVAATAPMPCRDPIAHSLPDSACH